MPTIVQSFYAIQLPNRIRPGRHHLAISDSGAGPKLFYWIEDARRYHRAVFTDVSTAKVVKVTATFRWPARV
jgi:hypothetical protein